jgi:putative two-component system response regulator
VADVFDALCMPRVYKPKWEPEKAREYILEESGKAFDPAAVDAFERVYGDIIKIYAVSDGKTTIIPGITKELHKHNF